jgi:hypothetical protein
MNAWKRAVLSLADLGLVPLVYPAARLLRAVRAVGVQKLPRCRSTLLRAGVFPIRDHYYEPQFDFRHRRHPSSQERPLPGINWNVPEQLALHGQLRFAGELRDLPGDPPEPLDYYLNNDSYKSGDAEYWYQLLRLKKPGKIIEIGSGFSTLMARKALRKNQEENPAYACQHICIEPFEMPWLEQTGVTVRRQRVEEIEASFFGQLNAGDILFIDSSHMIRPEGDVLFEYLEVLPSLQPGVIVHIHDILSPRNYLDSWLLEYVFFWNEQYLLEAFLTHNGAWKVIGALNYLKHSHYEPLKSICPFLAPDREPGSFYIQKIS